MIDLSLRSTYDNSYIVISYRGSGTVWFNFLAANKDLVYTEYDTYFQ